MTATAALRYWTAGTAAGQGARLAALALAVLPPSFLLAVGPLALGVPHLASDVRHLLVRRAVPLWWLAASAAFALALIALRACAEIGAARVPLAFENAVASAWVL